MRQPLLEMKYHNVYYYCNIVHNILHQQSGFLNSMHGLFEDCALLNIVTPWDKRTLLHKFAQYCIEGLFDEDLLVDRDEDPVAFVDDLLFAFRAHDMKPYGLDEFADAVGKTVGSLDHDDIYRYVLELKSTDEYEGLISRMTDEVFFIMFLNRGDMALLNSWAAGYVSHSSVASLGEFCDGEDLGDVFEADGKLRRRQPPRWTRDAVFYRERGHCARCGADLTGLSHIDLRDHFDHIIPLAEGGLNDVTNLQLLCGPCNLNKGKKVQAVSSMYERWYAVEDDE